LYQKINNIFLNLLFKISGKNNDKGRVSRNHGEKKEEKNVVAVKGFFFRCTDPDCQRQAEKLGRSNPIEYPVRCAAPKTENPQLATIADFGDRAYLKVGSVRRKSGNSLLSNGLHRMYQWPWLY
jgi:hypothetical protein